MNKETLTVETDEDSTIRYRNASGELHNPHGPSVIRADGDKYHHINGELHNPNGPAIVWADGGKAYYINDKLLNKTKFKAWQVQQDAPLHNETLTIHGIKYKLTAI
jgi:hypothetical protein